MAKIVEIDQAGFIISDVRKIKQTRPPFYDFNEANSFAANYWKNIPENKAKFSFTFRQLSLKMGAPKELIKRCMFKVTNISNPTIVNIELMGYDEIYAKNDPEPDTRYFVFEKQFINRIIDGEIDPNGMSHYSEKKLRAEGICVRLGDDKGIKLLILNTIHIDDKKITIFDGDDSGNVGGEPAGAGAILRPG